MSGSPKSRNRQERIESLGIEKPRLIQWWQDANKAQVSSRIFMAVAAAILVLVLCQSWRPTFAFRKGEIPSRDLVSRVTFEVPNVEETKAMKNRKRREQIVFYRNRTQPLDQLRAELKDKLFLVLGAPSFDQMNEEERIAFAEFYEGDESDESDQLSDRFSMLKATFAEDPELKTLEESLGVAMQENYRKGLLQTLGHDSDHGSQQLIRVFDVGNPEESTIVQISDSRIAEASIEFVKRLREQFRTRFPSKNSESQKSAQMVGDWLVARMVEHQTLQYDDEKSEVARKAAVENLKPVMTIYRYGESKLAEAGTPLGDEEIKLLRREWDELSAKMGWFDKLARVSAYAGMIAALYLLCGTYIFFVDDPSYILDHRKLAKLLAILVTGTTLGYWVSGDSWRAELTPLVMVSIVLGVVYSRELALLILAACCISLTLFLCRDLSELVLLASACTSCVLLLGRIRTRTHLLYVGGVSAAITFATVIGVGIVTGQTLSSELPQEDLEMVFRVPLFSSVITELLNEAAWASGLILLSTAAMTPLLPLVEKSFGVQTDLSLLELGDASHPLLRRLAQRAPGTYNHSINVASIAEAAADSIGANGLLVRVGAYFHDIGKMFKPEYFIENQSAGVNQHDALQPAMSTLVIIAHVKDGADLARSHGLPEPIVDFILQHHGTTLVEYFYREAARRSEEDPNGESVSDKDFRYPGPKPQTLEAAVMMLADTVESASRTLVDPTPSRIESLVKKIVEKKMSDGQFDQCGLTFKQLDRIRRSLVKSLTAIYHARVKYPGQESA